MAFFIGINKVINETEDKKEPKIITYKSDYKTWVAFYVDENNNQIGNCEYGCTKKQALINLRIESASN